MNIFFKKVLHLSNESSTLVFIINDSSSLFSTELSKFANFY
jgi:hypothetical protein